jgi:toxin secretion/phage lysis holin
MKMESLLQTILGAGVGTLALLTGWPWQLLIIWGILMVIDIISGILKAFKNKQWTSAKMKEGLIKKAFEFIILIATLLIQGVAIGAGIPVPIGSIIVGIFCFKEFGSIVENYIQSGNKLPNAIMKWFKVATSMIDSKVEGTEENNEENNK